MNRSFLVLPFLASTLATGCGLSESDAVDTDNVATDEFVVSMDLDGNLVDDHTQSFIVGNDENNNGSVTVIIDPDQKSPLGNALGQNPRVWGYGDGEYVESGDFVEFFPLVEAHDEDGNFLGYGNSGWRCDAIYELSVSEEGANVGEEAGWWNLGLGLNPDADITAYMVPHIDAAGMVDEDGNSCERRSTHLAMQIYADCTVKPLGFSIEPPDNTCY